MTAGKTLRDFWLDFPGEKSGRGNLALANFVLHHVLQPGASVGSIGAVSSFEAQALNAMVADEASLVVMAGDTPTQPRGYIASIAADIEHSGVPLRLQFADLTLASRWPKILAATAPSEIGLIGIDISWAANTPDFWSNLQDFLKGRHALVYIRGMLDYRQSELVLPFVRSMPAGCTLDIVAATPDSLWFAADPAQAAATRALLRGSGLFSPQVNSGSAAVDAPVVVTTDDALFNIDSNGKLPRLVIHAVQGSVGLDYIGGWSNAESDGCWTIGSEAGLKIVVPAAVVVPRTLTITGNSWIPPNMSEQGVKIGVGPKPTSWKDVKFTDPEEIIAIPVELEGAVGSSSGLLLQIKIADPGRPSDFGGQDSRMLGFKIRTISVFA